MLPGISGDLVSGQYLEDRQAAAGLWPADTRSCRTRLLRLDPSRWPLGPASGCTALHDVGAVAWLGALGYDQAIDVVRDGDVLLSTVACDRVRLAVLVAPWAVRLGRYRRLALASAVRRGAVWSILFNGTHLRLLDAACLYSRRHLEFDTHVIAGCERSLAALAATLHPGMLRRAAARTALHDLVAESDRLTAGVCRTLRAGVLSALGHATTALAGGRRRLDPHRTALDAPFEQALTIVYRLLFLLFAEARGLVPAWHPIYRESYSMDALCGLAESAGPADGLWDAIRAVGRLAHSGCAAGDLRVTAFNGRLFAPGRTPLANRSGLDDEQAREMVRALATTPARGGSARVRVAYRDLGVEQLGAVYEAVLDCQPRIVRADPAHRGGSAVEMAAGSGARKATGAFYTPRTFAEHLVRRSLEPLVTDRSPDDILRLRVLDPAMGSGAFLVAACRYLSGAYEQALVSGGGCHPSDFTEADRTTFRRTIAERVLYGVDINPMAVQLARLSLWLTTLASDRPLTFLDHHLQAGDSLVGAWLFQLTGAPRRLRGPVPDGTLPLFGEEGIHAAIRAVVPARFALESMPDDSLDAVRHKERALAGLNGPDGPLRRWKAVADAWCASWFIRDSPSWSPGAFTSLADAFLRGASSLPPAVIEQYRAALATSTARRRYFHWELEFPEVFFGADGQRRANPGFDAVIGNPPWEMVRADAGASAERARLKADTFAETRFVRESGSYEASGLGHVNRYQLFVERAAALVRSGGRLGLLLPSGFSVDAGSGALRRHLFARGDVDEIVGFENRLGIFPVHRSVKFLLLTATTGRPTRAITCRLGAQDPAVLDDASPLSGAPAVRVTPGLLERLSGHDLAIPELRHPIDLAIAERAASMFLPLGDASGWNARFGRELNATEDRHLFVAPGSGLPVVEGRHLSPFRVDCSAARFAIRRSDAHRSVGGRFSRWRLAYRDVASATNRTTLIAAMLPPDCVSTHTVFCLRTPLRAGAQWLLCALFNSFMLNYLVRLRVVTHVTTAIVEHLPVPRSEDVGANATRLTAIARHLSRCDRPDEWAWLQGQVAQLYALTTAEFRHVLDTFPLVPAAERHSALRSFEESW